MKRVFMLMLCLLLTTLLCGCKAPQEQEQVVDVPAQTPAAPEAPAETETPEAPPASENGLAKLEVGEIELDMDEDGAPELITVSTGEDGEVAVEFKKGELVQYDQYDWMYNLTCYAGDILEGDGSKEFLLIGDMGSDDYFTVLYRFTGEELEKDEIFGVVTGLTGDGQLDVDTVINVLGTYGASCTYQMAEDFLFEPDSAYTVDDTYEGFRESRKLTLQRDDLPVQLMEEDGSMPLVTLPRGTELLLKETDDISYAVFENLTDGGLVRVELTRDEDGGIWYIDGIAEDEWFEMLLYAG